MAAPLADRRLLNGWEGPAALIRAWNKADLPGVLPAPGGFLPVSAVTGEVTSAEILDRMFSRFCVGK